MILFEKIEGRLSQMPQSQLTTAEHGPCMNCSFTNGLLIEFYESLFVMINAETYAQLDRAVMRIHGITHYDHFLPHYRLPRGDFSDTQRNVFWCFKVETFLAALREVIADQAVPDLGTMDNGEELFTSAGRKVICQSLLDAQVAHRASMEMDDERPGVGSDIAYTTDGNTILLNGRAMTDEEALGRLKQICAVMLRTFS